MLKIAVAVACLAAIAVQADAAPVTDWKQIAKAMDAIPTAAGISLKKRLDSCKYTVERNATWMETRAVAWPDYGTKPGQTVFKLVFDTGPAPSTPTQQGVPGKKGLTAIWIIDQGKATPLSSWASALQNRPVPLSYETNGNC